MRIGAKLEEPVVLHGGFEPEKGKGMPYHGYLITDVASLYEPPTSELARVIDNHWWQRDSDLRTRWMPYDLGTLGEAREAVRRFEFPDDLVHEARRLSSRLVWCLTENSRPRVLKRQAEGRFDPMASGRLLASVRGGTYDPSVVRPFASLNRTNPERPHVGIMAAGNWGAMWRDKDYIPRVAALTMAIAWACETLGCFCTSAFGRRILAGYHDNAEALGLLWISKPGVAIPLQAYAAVMHREMYRSGLSVTTTFAHPDHIRVQKPNATLGNYLRPSSGSELAEAADEHFNGIAWLKQQGATITISIGAFDDANQADVAIDSNASLETAIDQIAVKLERQRAA